MVSWKEATAFCETLSKTSGKTFWLPTEAEWEFACRAGTATAFHSGAMIDVSRANYMAKEKCGRVVLSPEFRATTTAVGTFAPNAWGLFDMHGNVWQWCSDWMMPYPESEAIDPQEAVEAGELHVVRGGSWIDLSSWCSSASRESGAPDRRTMHIGFRVVLEVAE